MTRHVAPVDPVGRREQYNEAYRKINENDYMLLVVSLLIAMAACGAEKTENMDDPPESQIAEPSVSEWTRAGYFGDENERHKRHSFMGRLAHHLRDHFLPFPEDEKADRGKRDRDLRGDLPHYR